jgi:hypothetical protein
MVKLPEIERVELDIDSIKKFSSEADFIGLSVDLLIEVGSYVCVIGNAMPFETKTWNKDQAVLGGHLVRLYKLISGMLDQTCQHRREISFMLARMAFECIVNLSFLLKNYHPELLSSYMKYSLKHEKKLMRTINDNIKNRDGEKHPIEERMLKSIESTFEISGIKPEDINAKELRNWGNKNIYEKAEDVGLGEAYLGAFGGPSHGIHGNWHDLLEHHLEKNSDNSFSPDFEWHNPRPQYLIVIALQTAEVLKQYINWLDYKEPKSMVEDLNEFQNRVLTLDSFHEEWLSCKS